MKRLILSILLTLLASNIMAFDMVVSTSTGSFTVTLELLDATTVAFEGDEEEFRVVRDDALDYLAGGEMTDSLAAVVNQVDEFAKANGISELVGNSERIAYEIAKN